MQDAPTKETLLLALAKFLMMEVRPAVTDARLSFRLLIAANLAGIVAQECVSEDAQNQAELARLSALLPELAAARGAAGAPHEARETRETLAREIAEGNAKLAAGIKSGAVDIDPRGAAFAHVRRTLTEKLAVDNPRFDATRDLP